MVVFILCNAIFCSINIYESVYFSLTFFFLLSSKSQSINDKRDIAFLESILLCWVWRQWLNFTPRVSWVLQCIHLSITIYTLYSCMNVFILVKGLFFFTFIEVAIYLRLWRQCFFKTLTPRAIWECYNAHTFLLQVRSLLYILGQDVQGDNTESFILSWVSFSRRYHSLFIPLNSFCIR